MTSIASSGPDRHDAEARWAVWVEQGARRDLVVTRRLQVLAAVLIVAFTLWAVLIL